MVVAGPREALSCSDRKKTAAKQFRLSEEEQTSNTGAVTMPVIFTVKSSGKNCVG